MPWFVGGAAHFMMLTSTTTNGHLRLFGRLGGEECTTRDSDVELLELFAPFMTCTTGHAIFPTRN
jgi:hypothetical protein